LFTIIWFDWCVPQCNLWTYFDHIIEWWWCGKFFKVLDKLNIVKFIYGGLVLGLSQFSLRLSCLKNATCFKSGQMWLVKFDKLWVEREFYDIDRNRYEQLISVLRKTVTYLKVLKIGDVFLVSTWQQLIWGYIKITNTLSISKLNNEITCDYLWRRFQNLDINYLTFVLLYRSVMILCLMLEALRIVEFRCVHFFLCSHNPKEKKGNTRELWDEI